jgi:signal transduction histidine kinase/DNA-binding response OmpR family regulator
MPPSANSHDEPQPSDDPLSEREDRTVAPEVGEVLALTERAAISLDRQWRVTRLNRWAEALFGYSAAEASGLPLDTLIPRVLEGDLPRPFPREFDCARKDGSTFAASVTIVQIALAGEIVLAALIRETRRPESPPQTASEAQLRAQAARLAILADASHIFALAGNDAAAVLDRVARATSEPLGATCIVRLCSEDGQWLHVVTVHDPDPAVQEAVWSVYTSQPVHLEGTNMSAMVARTGHPLLMPAVDMEAVRSLAQTQLLPVFERFSPSSVLITPLRAHGTVLGALSFTRHLPGLPPFSADDLTLAQDLADRAALAIANARLYEQAQRELAERQRAEVALEAERALLARRVAERTADLSLANAELARAARLKDEFLANMSHELRTPLTSILGRAELLSEGIYGPVVAHQMSALNGIIESGHHLLTLINDILDLAKIEAGRLTLERGPVEVDQLATMAVRMVAEIALVKQIGLASSVDDAVRRVFADERRLKQILVNLLSNAVKFTPPGGRVGLEVRGDSERQAVIFSVWDTGIGIAEDDLQRLFEPFVQISSDLGREASGTGLGLALVARFAQAHGGGVAVESTPGRGSRFSVTIPWDRGDGRPPALTESALVGTPPAVRQVLVVEDSPTAAAQITRYLRGLGAAVEISGRGSGAVERAAELRPDLIILDLLLPDDDGWTVLRQLKADLRTRAIPVVLISVLDEPAQAERLGAAALLLKPIDQRALEQTLRRVLAGREEPPAQRAMVVGHTLQRPRVLLAEDNEETIATLVDYLGATGYELLVARNGGEAVMRAQEECPEVILMDIQMPEVDGLEAIRRIRADASLARVPIVAVTALAMKGDRERCLAAGADDYLTKPVSLRALVGVIEALRRR